MERFKVPLKVNTVSSMLFEVPSDDPVPSVVSETATLTPKSSHTSKESFFLTVPPTTPDSRFLFTHPIEPVQRRFPKPDSLQIPYVRQVGVKGAIEILSKFFSCQNYKINAIQFWFLDVITDCLWKLQDEYRFPERYQKVILEWVLYVFDLIGDPQKNLSRKEFFEIFSEALRLAEEKVQAGCEMVPSPDGLFTIVQADEEEEVSFQDSEEKSSMSSLSSGESFIAVQGEEDIEVFQLPKHKQKCYNDFYTPTDDEFKITEEEDVKTDKVEKSCEDDESVAFYQPDLGIPDRFRSSSTLESLPSDDSVSTPSTDTKFLWKRSSVSTEKLKEDCFEKNFEQTFEPHPTSEITLESRPDAKMEWEDYLTEREDMIHNMEKNIMINSCALSAVKDFVYDYFYESFQFTVVKLALINNFNSITEQINTKWCIPKVLKQELKKPKEKKQKKPKRKKEKKKKPTKKTKTKKDKKKKQKKDKKGKKKGKKQKEKKKKLTKEEKAELARLKREQELLEEQQRQAEENKRLLFPLNEATDDEFFKSIFEHWVKPNETKGKKTDKKKKKKK